MKRLAVLTLLLLAGLLPARADFFSSNANRLRQLPMCSPLTPTDTYVLTWSAASSCIGFAAGGAGSTGSAGNGLTLTSTTFSINTAITADLPSVQAFAGVKTFSVGPVITEGVVSIVLNKLTVSSTNHALHIGDGSNARLMYWTTGTPATATQLLGGSATAGGTSVYTVSGTGTVVCLTVACVLSAPTIDSLANLAVYDGPLILPASLSASTYAAQVDGATITWAIGSVLNAQASVTLAGNRTLNITGAVIGGNYVLKVTQDGTGTRTLALGTGCTWKVIGGGAGAITPSTAIGAVDILAFQYDGTNCLATFGKNYS